MKKTVISVVACATLVGSVALAAPASAATPLPFGPPVDVAGGLVTPLAMAVDSAGNAYVAQNYAALLTKVAPDGTVSVLFAGAPGEEVGSVSERRGTVYFTLGQQELGRAVLMSIPAAGGTATAVGDIGAFEAASNPDGAVSYGFVGIDPACAATLPPEVPATYTGIVDTHPYASAVDATGVYVADAAANAVFKVGYDGTVSTLALLPAQPPLTVTVEQAAAQGLDPCVARYPFVAEPVPTDVEIGPGGTLYVSTLPGGPEDPSFGARGSVYKVNPASGRVTRFATGFAGATGIAVSPKLGFVFVAELFGGPNSAGQVSVVLPGVGRRIASVPVTEPAALELAGKTVYVSRDVLTPGPNGAPNGTVTSASLFGRFD